MIPETEHKGQENFFSFLFFSKGNKGDRFLQIDIDYKTSKWAQMELLWSSEKMDCPETMAKFTIRAKQCESLKTMESFSLDLAPNAVTQEAALSIITISLG